MECNKFKKMKNGAHSVSPIIGLIFIISIFGLYGVVYLIDGILPKSLTIADEKDYPLHFITERAQQHLKALTSIGPRVVGYAENEIQAVAYLTEAINSIRQLAHASHTIDFDLQLVSGSFIYSTISAYSNVQNIVVKLHAKNSTNNSLLVNAHFDSAPTSPGGSDDGIHCAIMLEVLQKLTQTVNNLQHNIIFLFNGAEETGLQASHGFITQHKWAKEVRVVINLEATGVGGKEILFQSGPNSPWLIRYYKKVPHPNGQVFGEEIFQSGIIPSDTDFRIFRDFGGAIGFDFAYDRNGYGYHTKFDDIEYIPNGTYQHTGNNILALIRYLANAPELANMHEQVRESVVYYDFMGLFMVSYSGLTITIVNVLVSIFSLAVALKSFYDFNLALSYESFKYIGLCILVMLSSIIFALLFVLGVAVVIDSLKFSMSWYNNTWIILGLYSVPIVVVSSGVVALYNKYNTKVSLGISIHAQLQAHILRLIWTIIVIIGTCYGIKSTYIILMIVLFQTASFLVIHIFRLQYSVHTWAIIHVIFTLIPNIFLMKCGLELISLVVPLSGRIGSEQNPEIIIGGLVLALTILISSSYIPFLALLRKPHLVLVSLLLVFLVFFIIVFTPLGFPYSDSKASPAPQRFWIYHYQKELDYKNGTRNKSGFLIFSLDRNAINSIKNYVPELSNMTEIEDCDAFFCGIPPSFQQPTWIPGDQPILPRSIGLRLNSQVVEGSMITFNFTAFGAHSMDIYVSPRDGIELQRISVIEHLPRAIVYRRRLVYVIQHHCGKGKKELTFTVSIKKHDIRSLYVLDVAVVGQFLNDKYFKKTKSYEHFLEQFPSWTIIQPCLGSYKSWKF
ncbi:endoplasmic reticulum metallopeptidase 1-like [Photinus pyralis]|nr:endoplasmic reticulum metallopeptidase 1-like [Photinus pyralis]